MRFRVVGLVLAAVALFGGDAWAQAAWDSPMLVPPRAEAGFGGFLVDPAHAELGAMATWRSGGPHRMQFRLGVAERGGIGDGIDLFGGVDVSQLLVRASRDFPIDVAWVGGAGLGIGNDVRVALPVGLIAGRTFRGDGIGFTPYTSPRVVLDAVFGNGNGLDLELAVDIGVDVQFARDWLIRFGGTLGDHEAVAIGLVF